MRLPMVFLWARVTSPSATAGAGLAICLVAVMFTPVVTVLGYETLGHRHVRDALARMHVG